MHKARSPVSRDAVATSRCPECGTDVPVIGRRWLSAHREGVAEFSYLPGSGFRCSGSLLDISHREVHV